MESGRPARPGHRTVGIAAMALTLCLAVATPAALGIDAITRSQAPATPLAGTPMSGTPVTAGLPLTPAAADCVVEPVPFADLTPVAPGDVAAATPAPLIEGDGAPAGPAQVEAFIATLRLQIGCLNAGDLPRALALTGGAYYGRLFARTGTPDEAEYAILATPLPRAAETAIMILAVDAVTALPDGSLRADVTTRTAIEGTVTVNTVTLAPAPSSPTGYVIVDQRQVSRVTPTPTAAPGT